jgi:hypothetical protein
MLFDVRGRRKRVIQVVYVGLAVLFGASLVFFGTGSGVNGGLFDAFTGGGGGDASVFEDQYDEARAKAQTAPRSPEAQVAVVRASYNYAADESQTGTPSDKAQAAIIAAATAWERYLKLKPKKIEYGPAATAAIIYEAMRDYPSAAKAQRLAVRDRPSSAGWFSLARYYYGAGDVEAGDRAAKASLRKTPADLRNSVRAQIAEAKKEGAKAAKEIAAARKQAREQGKKAGTEAFGPLPGAGATGAGGVTP